MPFLNRVADLESHPVSSLRSLLAVSACVDELHTYMSQEAQVRQVGSAKAFPHSTW